MWEMYSEKVGSDETKLVDSVTALRNVSQLNCKYMYFASLKTFYHFIIIKGRSVALAPILFLIKINNQ